MLGFRDFFSDFLGRKSFYISERYDKIRMYTNQQQKMTGTKNGQYRRSIRKYKPDKIEKSVIEEIVKAGILAPSAKNRQPWKYIVYTGASKEHLLDAMERGLVREKSGKALLPESAFGLPDALEEYVQDSMHMDSICCFLEKQMVGFLSLKQTKAHRHWRFMLWDFCRSCIIWELVPR